MQEEWDPEPPPPGRPGLDGRGIESDLTQSIDEEALALKSCEVGGQRAMTARKPHPEAVTLTFVHVFAFLQVRSFEAEGGVWRNALEPPGRAEGVDDGQAKMPPGAQHARGLRHRSRQVVDVLERHEGGHHVDGRVRQRGLNRIRNQVAAAGVNLTRCRDHGRRDVDSDRLVSEPSQIAREATLSATKVEHVRRWRRQKVEEAISLIGPRWQEAFGYVDPADEPVIRKFLIDTIERFGTLIREGRGQ